MPELLIIVGEEELPTFTKLDNVHKWYYRDDTALVTNVKEATGLKSGPIKVTFKDGTEKEIGRHGDGAEIIGVVPDMTYDPESEGGE